MATVTFEAETLDELTRKMRSWLRSTESSMRHTNPISDVMEKTSQATSDLARAAIELVAKAAPEPVSSSEIFRILTSLGFEISDSAKRTVTSTLDALSSVDSQDGLMEKVDKAREAALYEMSQAVARGVLRIIGL